MYFKIGESYGHIYQGSGLYCTNHDDYMREMNYVTKFAVKCPECGKYDFVHAELWDVIDYARRARGISIAELARRAKLSRSTLFRILNRYNIPGPDTLELIADALNINLKVLLGKRNRLIDSWNEFYKVPRRRSDI